MTSQWWEAPPPKPKKQRDWGNAAASAGVGAAAGAGAMAGAMLLTRGKVKPKTQVITRTRVKTKIKRTKEPKNPAPKPPSFKEAAEPEIPLTPPRPSREQIGRQRRMNLQRIAEVEAQKAKPKYNPPPSTKRPEVTAEEVARVEADPNLKGIAPNASMVEVDRALAARSTRRANAQLHGKRGKNPRPTDGDREITAKRLAFEIEEEIAIFKAWKGEKGDKRNTKYAIAGGLGYVVGVQSGMRLGARAAGTTFHANRDEVVRRMTNYTTKQQKKLKKKGLPVPTKNPSVAQGAANLGVKGRHGGFGTEKVKPASEWTPKMREINRINNSVKGSRELVRGGAIGAAAGTAAGLGLMAAYRANKRKKQQVVAL